MSNSIFKKSPSFWAITLIIAVALVNLGIALNTGLGADEAHYALYGQKLDWSYFDHPPMVGWIQAFFVHHGHNELWVRMPALILNLLNLASIYWITKKFLAARCNGVEIQAVFLYFSAPMFIILGIAFLPKTPCIFFICWATYFAWSCTQFDKFWSWIALAFSLGMAGLSEYDAILPAFGIFVFLIWKKPRLFLSWKPYLSVMLALALVSPVFIWNYQHQWISFTYQLNHGFGSVTWKFSRFLASTATQFAVYGPAVFIFGLLSLKEVFAKWRDLPSQLLACVALPTLLIFFYSGGNVRLLMHWEACGWIFLIPLAARYAIENRSRSWVRRVLQASVIWVILIILACFLILTDTLRLPAEKNPFRDMRSLPAVAAESLRLMNELKLTQGGPKTPMLFVKNWTFASRLAWYSDSAVQVAQNKMTQFDLWYEAPDAKSDGILVVPKGEKNPPETESTVRGEFAHCRLLSSFTTKSHGKDFDHFYFYHCWNFNN